MLQLPRLIKRHLSLRISLMVVFAMAILLMASLIVMLHYSRKAVKEETIHRAMETLEGTVTRIDNILLSVEQSIGNIFYAMLPYLDQPEKMYEFSRMLVETNHYVGGCAIAFKEDYFKDRKLFMAYRVTSGSGNEARTETRNFITSVAGENPGFPYVCAYWHKDDGTTNCVAFAGRRGDMCKDEKFSLFSVEFMTAIDRVIGEYLAKDPSHSTIDQIVSNSLKTISFEKVGAKGGSVAINPPTGLLPEGGKVTLHAKPDKEAMFVGWRYPDGSHAGWNMKLDVSGSMPAGKYKAVFRNPAECPPPELTNVTTSFFAQVKQKFVCTVPVSDSCRPVSFRAAKSLPKGLKLDKITGRISGAPRVRGTSTFTIYVTGADPAHTVKSFTVSLMVQ